MATEIDDENEAMDWGWMLSEVTDEEIEEYTELMGKCGLVPSLGGCQLTGTEFCEFECPINWMNE